ncbi:MAG: hypothetical protein ACU843_09965, partial [Gammaproteobacteria bacterium]
AAGQQGSVPVRECIAIAALPGIDHAESGSGLDSSCSGYMLPNSLLSGMPDDFADSREMNIESCSGS